MAGLLARIEQVESEIATLHAMMLQPDFFEAKDGVLTEVKITGMGKGR